MSTALPVSSREPWLSTTRREGASCTGRGECRDAAAEPIGADPGLDQIPCETLRDQLAQERARLRLLLDINNSLVSKFDIRDLFAAISESLRRITRHRYSQIVLFDRKTNRLKVAAVDFPKGKGLIHESLEVPCQGSPAGLAYTSRQPLLISHLERDAFPSETTDRLLAEGVQSICLAPLVRHDRALGVISIGR